MNSSSVIIARSVIGLAVLGSPLASAFCQAIPAMSSAPAPAVPQAPTPALPRQVSPLPAMGTTTATLPANGALSLDQVIQQAQRNEPAFALAIADSKVAQLDTAIARAGLLPSATFHNQYLYTQGNGTSTRTPNGLSSTAIAPVVFIANNAVHEYTSQGVVNENLGLQQYAAFTVAAANAARATAELEIARRGLLSTVVSLYYQLGAAETRLATTQRALDEANSFLTQTREREAAREAAHADVLKAELQQQQRIRDLADAKLAASRAHLDLGVLLYTDPRTPFQTEAAAPAALPDRAGIETLAGQNNAELRSAMAGLKASEAGILAARAGYLPDLALSFGYGIDAAQFAHYGPDGVNNLGYSATATVDIPLWDWLATQHRVKQSQIRRDAAKVVLTSTQRRLIASLAEYYDEAAVARDQLASLDASVDTATESLRLTRLRYTNGEATVLEVVDAQGALIAVENARADGIVRYQVALAALQTLTGRF